METFARRGDPGEEFGEGQPPGEGGGGLSPERGSRARSREGGVGRRARRGAVRSGEARATWGWRVCMCRGEKGLTRSHFCRRWAAGVSDCVVITPPSLARADTEAMDDLCRTDDVASLRSMGDTPLARQMLATMMRDLVQSFARRDADLRPARDALAAAEEKKRVGNDAFRAGDYLAAFSAYGEAHERLDAASREPTTSYAAEVLRLVLLSNSAQCALKANNPAGAANFCRDALRLSACTSDERVFKKILVRLALAHEALGEHDKAVAVVAEARIRGLAATEFDALESRLPAAVDRAPDGALPPTSRCACSSCSPSSSPRARRTSSDSAASSSPASSRTSTAATRSGTTSCGACSAPSPSPTKKTTTTKKTKKTRAAPTPARLPRTPTTTAAARRASPRWICSCARARTRGRGTRTAARRSCSPRGADSPPRARAVPSAPRAASAPFDEAAVNAADANGWTALHVACAAGAPSSRPRKAREGECGGGGGFSGRSRRPEPSRGGSRVARRGRRSDGA